MKVVALILLIGACNAAPVTLPTQIQISSSQADNFAAIAGYNDELNKRLGCQPFTIVQTPAFVHFRWSTEAAMQSHFNWGSEAGLVADEFDTHDNGFYEASTGFSVWVATDYGVAWGKPVVPDEIGRIWLHVIALWAGIPANDTDKNSIGYDHPTWADDPVAALISALNSANINLCSNHFTLELQ